ncbi:MAG: hypothetical protein KF712_19690 [Akkermansiaceae bacterium]|nr:hypothetical protein [Akkermansiaceae bacterium]
MLRASNLIRSLLFAYSPTNEDYVQSLYWYLGIIRPISEAILHDSTHAYRPNRGIDSEIEEFRKAVIVQPGGRPVTVAQEDIVECFDNAPIALVLNYLPPFTRKQVTILLQRYRETVRVRDRYPHGGPQGHPATCALVNMTIDHLLAPIRKDYTGRAFIITYSDDLTIIGDSITVLEVTQAIRRAFARHGLQLNQLKSRRTPIIPGSKIVLLGYEFEWGYDINKAPIIRPKRGAYENLSDKIGSADTHFRIRTVIQGWKACYGWTNDPEHASRTKQAIDEGLRRHSFTPTATASPSLRGNP